jgi:hypothetical protein
VPDSALLPIFNLKYNEKREIKGKWTLWTARPEDVFKFLANMLSIYGEIRQLCVLLTLASFNTNVLADFNRDIVQQLNLFTDLDKPAGPSL